mmetsp:Transcript_2609/g.3968  ORF Transcript_2609/g.3968 Transcript_2609/m.3968 type:complete len:311 (-) Transcript_2609:1158-2090(-)
MTSEGTPGSKHRTLTSKVYCTPGTRKGMTQLFPTPTGGILAISSLFNVAHVGGSTSYNAVSYSSSTGTLTSCFSPSFRQLISKANMGPKPLTDRLIEMLALYGITCVGAAAVDAAAPWPSVKTFAYALAAASLNRAKSFWNVRCISMACSFSRWVCSTYNLVFFGTAKGMFCSGGGAEAPPPPPDACSRFADLGKILMSKAPVRVTVMRVWSSRPNRPKYSAVVIPWMEWDESSTFSEYTRMSPLAKATTTARGARAAGASMRCTATMAAGILRAHCLTAAYEYEHNVSFMQPATTALSDATTPMGCASS